jgi:hypothetical protein
MELLRVLVEILSTQSCTLVASLFVHIARGNNPHFNHPLSPNVSRLLSNPGKSSTWFETGFKFCSVSRAPSFSLSFKSRRERVEFFC